MQKVVVALLSLFLTAVPGRSASLTSDVPEGVVVHSASTELNEKAKNKLLSAFGPNRGGFLEPGLFAPVVVCGPLLWSELSSDKVNRKAFRKASPVPTTINMPTGGGGSQVLQAAAFRGADVPTLVTALTRLCPAGAQVAIESLTRSDYALFWALISFPIEEPVFIARCADVRLLVNFDGNSSISRIDDFSKASSLIREHPSERNP